eukprot:TRINITY_DN27294_c0_g1_i2.p1 TRINITY_DN27294_c0_g1~~TRINITY_DN27294_c0_g1_i2.p1  ORF type:complete len:201 (-),score=49.87 TRINITY_DN27294_c0_g1_i2:439-1041(-)
MRVLPWNQAGQVPLALSKKTNKFRVLSKVLLLCSCCKCLRRPNQEVVDSIQRFSQSSKKTKSQAQVDSATAVSNENSVNNSMLPSADAPVHGFPDLSQEVEPRMNGEPSLENVPLKSTLKKPNIGESSGEEKKNSTELSNGDPLENGAGVSAVKCGKRRVQWNDADGGELVYIKEFEPSDSGESDDDEDEANQGCSCIIQ